MSFGIATSFRSQNYNNRPAGVVPSGIVIHSTEGIWPTDRDWLCNDHSNVSCHYLIAPTGGIYQLVADEKRAWHAGVGSYLGFGDWNDISLGIEVSHKQGQGWPEIQRQALAWLCKLLITKYGIRRSMVVAHRWIAPTRKTDPTDWDDNGLMAWIEGLYVPDFDVLWGSHVPYFRESGIAASWRDHAAALGQAVSDETGDQAGRVWRLFQSGAISFNPATKETVVYVPRKA